MTSISNSRIDCLLYYGNRLANPPIPANLTIKFTKTLNGYPSADLIRLMIANVRNPTTVGMNIGVKVNVNKYCEAVNNQPCHYFEARGFYVTTATTENEQSTTTTFSSSSNLVLATGLTHTFTLTLTASLGTNDAIYIIYP